MLYTHSSTTIESQSDLISVARSAHLIFELLAWLDIAVALMVRIHASTIPEALRCSSYSACIGLGHEAEEQNTRVGNTN